MIVDKIDNIQLYKQMLNNLELGLQAMATQIDKLEVGRYEFDGGYFMVQKGETKPMSEGLFEAHKKYVDVQIVVKGSEEVAWSDIRDLVEAVPYNADKDALYLEGCTDHFIRISEGMFYIAFPHDGHRPVRHTEHQQTFTKIVLKLPV